MAEKQLEITQRDGKEGKVYLNVDLRTLEGPANDFVIVEKIFPDGRKFEKSGQYGPYSFYSVNMKYQGQTVGTLMSDKLYQQWEALPMGPVKVQASLYKDKKGAYRTQLVAMTA